MLGREEKLGMSEVVGGSIADTKGGSSRDLNRIGKTERHCRKSWGSIIIYTEHLYLLRTYFSMSRSQYF
jgi:hypothetical protein